jgi:DNA-binding NarL/FixJ family response regulator
MQEYSTPIKILLIERLEMLREALRGLISQDKGIFIAGDCGDYDKVIPLMAEIQPDVLVLHLHAGDDDMLNMMVEVTSVPEHPPMLSLTADAPESSTYRSALHAGVAGMIEMKEPKANLHKAIRCVHAGELWINRRTTALMMQELRQQKNRQPGQEDHKEMLSPRQREIVGLVAAGLSTEAIAERLFISEKTVRNHLVTIYAKLDVSNRIQLTLCAGKLGIT